VFVRKLAVLLSGLCVILRFLVLAHRVVVLSLVMVMRGGVVVTRRVVMMLGRRMFCHLSVLPLRRMRPDRKRGRKSSPARFAPMRPDQVSRKTDTGRQSFCDGGARIGPASSWRCLSGPPPRPCLSTQRRKQGFPFVPDPDTRPVKPYIRALDRWRGWLTLQDYTVGSSALPNGQ
jgi:hypothetical protein